MFLFPPSEYLSGVDDVAVIENGNWDKRMSTVVVTVLMRIKPVVVFFGKGRRISATERAQWDPDILVTFQVVINTMFSNWVFFSKEEAVADEETWNLIIEEWKANVPKDFPKLLIFDHAPVHGLQSLTDQWRKMLVRNGMMLFSFL